MTIRTDEEILARVEEVKDRDWMGFERNDLIIYLPFDKARPFLVEGTTEDEWETLDRSRESVLKTMLDYMPFAWDKANNKRGFSAGRSMSHYAAWTWMAGDDFGNLTDYECYGKDHLRKICNHYGWDADQWDDGVRDNW